MPRCRLCWPRAFPTVDKVKQHYKDIHKQLYRNGELCGGCGNYFRNIAHKFDHTSDRLADDPKPIQEEGLPYDVVSDEEQWEEDDEEIPAAVAAVPVAAAAVPAVAAAVLEVAAAVGAVAAAIPAVIAVRAGAAVYVPVVAAAFVPVVAAAVPAVAAASLPVVAAASVPVVAAAVPAVAAAATRRSQHVIRPAHYYPTTISHPPQSNSLILVKSTIIVAAPTITTLPRPLPAVVGRPRPLPLVEFKGGDVGDVH